jgi:dolichol kinase
VRAYTEVTAVPPRLSLRQEVARKALHLVFVVVPLSYAFGFPRRLLVLALGAASVAAVTIELARAWHSPTRERFARWVGVLLREHEHTRWSGATWLVLSMLGLAALAPRQAAIAAMWAISAGDAAAALVGRAFDRESAAAPERRVHKTIRGSIACFLMSLVGALALARLSPVESVVAALLATAAERPRGWVDDNVRIAVVVSVGILLWHKTFS